MIQFQGDLELIGFCDVLQFLAGGRKTGALIIERGDGVARRIFFDKGEIIAASSSRVDDYLGRILVRRGATTEAEVEAAIKARPPGVRIGDALVARGVLTADEVQHFLFEQFRKIIFDTFHWTKGAFRFVTGAKPEGGRISPSLSADNLILEGLRRLDESKIIDRRLPGEDELLVAATEEPDESKLGALEQQVLGKLRDPCSRRDLLRALRADEFELRKTVFKLYEAGLIEACKAPAATPEAEERLMEELREMIASYTGIFALIHQSLVLELGRDVEAPLAGFFRQHPVGDTPVLQGLALNGDGELDGSCMLKNVRALPTEKRRRALSDALSQMLSYQLKVVRDRVGPEVATGILEVCSTLLR